METKLKLLTYNLGFILIKSFSFKHQGWPHMIFSFIIPTKKCFRFNITFLDHFIFFRANS